MPGVTSTFWLPARPASSRLYSSSSPAWPVSRFVGVDVDWPRRRRARRGSGESEDAGGQVAVRVRGGVARGQGDAGQLQLGDRVPLGLADPGGELDEVRARRVADIAVYGAGRHAQRAGQRGGDVGPLGRRDLVGVGVHLVGQHGQGQVGAVAGGDRAAGHRERDRDGPLLAGQLPVPARLHALQLDEPPGEQGQHQDHAGQREIEAAVRASPAQPRAAPGPPGWLAAAGPGRPTAPPGGAAGPQAVVRPARPRAAALMPVTGPAPVAVLVPAAGPVPVAVLVPAAGPVPVAVLVPAAGLIAVAGRADRAGLGTAGRRDLIRGPEPGPARPPGRAGRRACPAATARRGRARAAGGAGAPGAAGTAGPARPARTGGPGRARGTAGHGAQPGTGGTPGIVACWLQARPVRRFSTLISCCGRMPSCQARR